ncbi:hypothetical protein HQN60_12550 [Deefgea piscis]|uniref:Uncharacterized protein n=1 Tax=Deefgea piscis TaxID=2739061 RepID=A0A6M8STR0_9NEIS|nr:phage regulatory CII family protein [Deefgea piscis]QKJ67468.1 hypothetical protein HQN60_12550 [Deefgea piscis]
MNNAEAANHYRRFVEAIQECVQAAGVRRLSVALDRAEPSIYGMANPNLPEKQLNALQLAEVVSLSQSPAIASALAALTGHVVIESRLLASDLIFNSPADLAVQVMRRQLGDSSVVAGQLAAAFNDLVITRSEADDLEASIADAIKGLNAIRATLARVAS